MDRIEQYESPKNNKGQYSQWRILEEMNSLAWGWEKGGLCVRESKRAETNNREMQANFTFFPVIHFQCWKPHSCQFSFIVIHWAYRKFHLFAYSFSFISVGQAIEIKQLLFHCFLHRRFWRHAKKTPKALTSQISKSRTKGTHLKPLKRRKNTLYIQLYII